MGSQLFITLFLCGDVMTGRGIDQILPRSNDPVLYEPYVKSARAYVDLAERASGPIERPVGYEYLWGDALRLAQRTDPDVRIINLETSVTTSGAHWKGKSIHYRMHPANVRCITAAKIDCCVLANNHVLDWGRPGLLETIATLDRAGVKTAGAGEDREAALAPAVIDVADKGRVLVFAFGSPSSGIAPDWAATADRPGVNLAEDLSDEVIGTVAQRVKSISRQGDVVVFSIHWGGNWGYGIPDEHVTFAHRLIDMAGVDIVHGHSSHHFKGMEVYHRRLVLFGCGDLLNDYEGIGGHEGLRPDLALIYLPTVDVTTGALTALRVAPVQIRRFRLNAASQNDAGWVRDTLNRESGRFGVRFHPTDDGLLTASWD